jgi:hypothetical protein
LINSLGGLAAFFHIRIPRSSGDCSRITETISRLNPLNAVSRRLERFSNRVFAINILRGERLIDSSLHKARTFHLALTCPVNPIDKPKAMAYKQSEVVHPASHHQKLQ